jgi:membrane associated rhomboid family serine protease
MVENKFGSKNLFWMILFTAGITGILNVVFFPNVALCGASGLVFMLIILSAYSLVYSDGIPLTFILVALVYIGNEIINGIFVQDDISQFAHILGGLCGGIFGFILGRKSMHSSSGFIKRK